LGFSNWGLSYQIQGILAPGENILGASPDGGIVTNSGTSYATPIVSGIAALLLSLQLKREQKLSPITVREAILNSALGCEDDPVPDCRRLLAGRLNIKGAVSKIMKGGVTMSDSEERQEGIQPHGQEDADPKTPTHKKSATTIEMGRSSGSQSTESEASTQPQKPSLAISSSNVNPMTQDVIVSTGVHASTCGCLEGGPCTCQAAKSVELVFALGALGYDFGTEARRDSIFQHMATPANTYDSTQLLAYLEKNPWDAAAILWTLNLDATPIYAIEAHGAFANDVYKQLRNFLGEQTRGEVERISIPGYIGGSARLFNGQVVPVIWPELRGMYSWNTSALVEAVCGPPLPAKSTKQEKNEHAQKAQSVANFLLRVYDELRNLGVTPQERAINYAATNVFQVGEIFSNALKEGMHLDIIGVERSPICRSESDCWDVKLTFFNPRKVLEQARKVYRFTVDVSDVVPVIVGSVRSWFVR